MVCFIVLIILFFGIGCFNFFINCLNKLWFFVWLIVLSFVFSNFIFSLFKIFDFDNFIVIFNLVWLFNVGRRVLGCFFCKIFEINFKVIGLI